jgi:hypothetical protein
MRERERERERERLSLLQYAQPGRKPRGTDIDS